MSEPLTRTKQWPESEPRFVFFFEVHSHHVDFRAVEVTGWNASGDKWPVSFGEAHASRAEDAETYASGHVKWDGCVNLIFDAQERGMLHFCGPEDEPLLAVLMRGIYALGPSMESWSV